MGIAPPTNEGCFLSLMQKKRAKLRRGVLKIKNLKYWGKIVRIGGAWKPGLLNPKDTESQDIVRCFCQCEKSPN